MDKVAAATPLEAQTNWQTKAQTDWLTEGQTQAIVAGSLLWLRPVRADDAEPLGALFGRQSFAMRRLRFNGAVSLSPERLAGWSTPDGQQQGAWVVESSDAQGQVLLVDARWVRVSDNVAELAMLVDEAWHQRGLGAWALQALQAQAHRVGLQQLCARVAPHNTRMLRLLRRSGYTVSSQADDDGQTLLHSGSLAWTH